MSKKRRQHIAPATEEIRGEGFSTDQVKRGLNREFIRPEHEATHREAVSRPAPFSSSPRVPGRGARNEIRSVSASDAPPGDRGGQAAFTYTEHGSLSGMTDAEQETPSEESPAGQLHSWLTPPPRGGHAQSGPSSSTPDDPEPAHIPRYGTMEHAEKGPASVGGAGGDAVAADTSDIIKTSSRAEHKSIVLQAPQDLFKKQIVSRPEAEVDGHIPSQAEVYASRVWGKDRIASKGVVRTVGSIVAREIERDVEQTGGGDIDSRTAGQSIKYGYKTGKLAGTAAAIGVRGAYRLTRYGYKLKADVRVGALTEKEALASFGSQIKSNACGSLPALGGLVKTGVGRAVADFHGSDDLGMEAITKPKDVIVGTRRTLQAGKAMTGSLSKGFRAIPRAAQRVHQIAQGVVSLGKRLLSNPLVMKGVAMAAGAVFGVFMIFSVISGIVGAFTSMTLKSPDYELTRTYLYITELDARMQYRATSEDTPGIDGYSYYVNGVPTSRDSVTVYTDADLLLMYFDSKYDDYTLDGTSPDGATVRNQIAELHAALHQLSTTQRAEIIQGADGEPQTVIYLDTYLTTLPTADYLAANATALLSEEQQSKLETLKEAGPYSFRQELATPFIGVDWFRGVTSRFGWRIHPITGELSPHNALDIAQPGGTPINACMSGVAVVPNYHPSYGNFVKIMDAAGNYTLYAHMSGVAVANGQEVSIGDVIGYVGTTGSSTGNHLHLEYFKDGHILNPLFFVER